jgi:hypothetical protein
MQNFCDKIAEILELKMQNFCNKIAEILELKMQKLPC